MKNKILLVSVIALSGVVIGAITTPESAFTRLSSLSRLIQQFGVADTFAKLNGGGPGNYNDDGEMIMRNAFNSIKTADGSSYIVCVKNSVIAVHQRQPSMVGKNINTTSLKGLHGAIVKKLGMNKGSILAVPFASGLGKVIDATTGKPLMQSRRAYAAHSRYLLGKKNTGEKFYCAVID